MGKQLSNYITYEHDAGIDRIVSSWPQKIDCTKLLIFHIEYFMNY